MLLLIKPCSSTNPIFSYKPRSVCETMHLHTHCMHTRNHTWGQTLQIDSNAPASGFHPAASQPLCQQIVLSNPACTLLAQYEYDRLSCYFPPPSPQIQITIPPPHTKTHYPFCPRALSCPCGIKYVSQPAPAVQGCGRPWQNPLRRRAPEAHRE